MQGDRGLRRRPVRALSHGGRDHRVPGRADGHNARLADVAGHGGRRHGLRAQHGITGSLDLFAFPAWLLAVSLGFAVAVSVVAGIYPALRAARVDPIRACDRTSTLSREP